MQTLRKILYSAFAIIAGLMVVLSLITVTPIYYFIFLTMGKYADRYAVKLSRIWAWVVLFCCAAPLKVHGKRLIKPEQTYVFISNHRSFLDIPVCARTTTNTFKYLAKEELRKVPFLGYIIGKLYITVRRQSMRDRVNALKKMEESIKNGISVWLYPEGTRNATDQPLADFQDGAFTLAVNTGVPVAVLTIMDTRKNLPPGKLFDLTPAKVEAWWSEPIPTIGLTRKDIPDLKEKVRNLMLSIIENKIR